MKEIENAILLGCGEVGVRGGLAVTVERVAGDRPILRFVASDETLDRYGEVVRLAGWDLTRYRQNPVVVDTHDYSSVSKILGRSVAVEITEGKLVNEVEFALDNPLGVLAWRMAKEGFIKSESVGFIPKAWENGDGKTQPRRTYTQQELVEISLVAVPANPAATVLALRSGAVSRGELRAAAEFLQEICRGSEMGVPTGKAGATGGRDEFAQGTTAETEHMKMAELLRAMAR
jgi:HK97 family phage prohead protease